MTLILEWTISNVVVATALALLAASVGRVATRPQITHALWVLVLIKLITPPLLPIPVLRTPSAPVALQPPGKPTPNSMPELQPETSTTAAPRNNEPQTEPEQTPLPVDISGARSNTEISHNQSPAFISPVVPLRLLVGVWITGALLWFLLAATRLLRFGRVLRYANPATCDIDTEVKAIASKFGLRTVPRVLMVDGTVPPLLWGLGPWTCMVLPNALLNRLQRRQRTGLIAHELAHLKRCDHWLRWLEFVVLGLHWWNPVAWWARARVQQTEEECCATNLKHR